MQVPDRTDDLNRFYAQWDAAESEEKEFVVSLPVHAVVDIEVYASSEEEAIDQAIKKLQEAKKDFYNVEWNSDEVAEVEEM